MTSSNDNATPGGPREIEAFVVWLDAPAGDDALHGVVERMVDSERSTFDSVEGLVAVLTRRGARAESS